MIKNGEKDFAQADRHGPVHVQVVRGRRAQPVRAQPGLLGARQAVRRRVGGHLDRRQLGAPERTARRPDRHDEPARLRPGQGAEVGARRSRSSTRRARPTRCSSCAPTGRPSTTSGVRQAFRLIVDRQALINVALGGFGTLGNDLFGGGLPYFAKSLARAQAGHRAGQVAAEEGRQDQSQRDAADLGHRAGLHRRRRRCSPSRPSRPASRCTIKKEPANAYFDTSLLYTKMDLRAVVLDDGLAGRVLQPGARLRRRSGTRRTSRTRRSTPGAQGDRRHARSTRPPRSGSRCRRSSTTRGGYIGWANQNIVDAASNKVQGHDAERVLQPRRLELPRRLARGLGARVGGHGGGPARLRRRVPPGGTIRSRAFVCAAWLRRSGRCSSSRCSSSSAPRCCRATPPAPCSARPRHRRRWRNCGKTMGLDRPDRRAATPTG